MRIDYYFSVLSPWAYFAGSRLEEIAARHGALIAYKPVDPAVVFERTGGLPLAQRPAARKAYRLQELRRASAKTGLPYHEQPAHWPTDALPASTALIAVADKGGDVARLARSLMAAVWTGQKDIAEPAVLAEALALIGEDAGALRDPMAKARETFAALTDEAVAKGVFGVPSYLVGDELFWGQDRLDDLDWHLSRQA